MQPTPEQVWESGVTRLLEQHGYPPQLWHRVNRYAETAYRCTRPQFDAPHARAATLWMLEILEGLKENGGLPDGIDPVVLLTAIRLHDIGYAGLFKSGILADQSAVLDQKQHHMLRGSWRVRDFLELFAYAFLTPAQIEEVVFLVRIHDELDQVATLGELLIVEADTLGMLDVALVEPTYHGEDALKFLSAQKTERRLSLLHSVAAVRALPSILAAFRAYIMERDFKGPEIKAETQADTKIETPVQNNALTDSK